jgi:hypothetical protein
VVRACSQARSVLLSTAAPGRSGHPHPVGCIDGRLPRKRQQPEPWARSQAINSTAATACHACSHLSLHDDAGVPIDSANVDLLERVRTLRIHGRTPKQIARILGVPSATVAPLIRTIAAQNQAPVPAAEVVECWVSPGWSIGLTVGDHLDWPDIEADVDGPSGVACVLVARRANRRQVSVCGYLVDVYCLGVKNALGPLVMPERDLLRFRRLFFSAFPAAPLAAPLEMAQHLVFGAVEHARGLGFQPHPDFDAAADHLGQWTGPSAIAFGNDGKPDYIEGPYDNAGHVLATLRRTVGPDTFHFLVGVDAF